MKCLVNESHDFSQKRMRDCLSSDKGTKHQSHIKNLYIVAPSSSYIQ